MSRVEVIGNATLYHGDYRDCQIEGAVISDPPYGIGFGYSTHDDTGGSEYTELLRPLSHLPKALLQYPEEMMRYMSPLFGAPDDCFAWCYNSNTNRQFRLWGFWGIKPNWDAVRQPAKNIGDPRVNDDVRSYDWCSDIQQVKNVSDEKTDHPCQIPVALMKRVILLAGAELVTDPFMGSGSTGVAALELGKPFIGHEKDLAYFDIACRRIEDVQRQGKLL